MIVFSDNVFALEVSLGLVGILILICTDGTN